MKNLLIRQYIYPLVSILFLLPNPASSQNLVQNPDFELGAVPNALEQIHFATNWDHGCSNNDDIYGNNVPVYSSDLLDVNSSFSNVQIPNSLWGNLGERTGDDRYAHIARTSVYDANQQPPMWRDWDEHIRGTLSRKLEAGCYNVSFYAAFAPNLIPSNANQDTYLEVELYNGNDCSSALLIYSTPSPVANTSWTNYSHDFEILPGQAGIYDKIGFRFKQVNHQPNVQQSIFIDEISLEKTIVTADAGLDITICPGDVITIGSAPVAGHTYSWTPTGSIVSGANTSSPQVSPTVTTTYTVVVTDPDGCEGTDQVTVTMKPGYECKCCKDYNRAVTANAPPSYNLFTLVTDFDYHIVADPATDVRVTIIGALETNPTFPAVYFPSIFSGTLLSIAPTVTYPPYSNEIAWNGLPGTPINQSVVLQVQYPPLPTGVNSVNSIIFFKWEFFNGECNVCDVKLTSEVFERKKLTPWVQLINHGFLSSEDDPMNVELNKARAKLKNSDIGPDIENWYSRLNQRDWITMVVKNPQLIGLVDDAYALGKRMLVEKGRLKKDDLDTISSLLKNIEGTGTKAPEGLIPTVMKRLNKGVGKNWSEVLEILING